MLEKEKMSFSLVSLDVSFQIIIFNFLKMNLSIYLYFSFTDPSENEGTIVLV